METVRSGAIVLAPIDDSELRDIHALMSRYADRPWSSRVRPSRIFDKRERLSTVFTVDHSDSDTYRIEGRCRFRLVPSSRP